MITLIVEQITDQDFHCINSVVCCQQKAYTGEQRFNWQLGNRIQLQRLVDAGVVKLVTVEQAAADPQPNTFFLVTVPEVRGTFDTAWIYWLRPETVQYLQQYRTPILISQPAEYDLHHSVMQHNGLVHSELLKHLHFALCHRGLPANSIVLHNISVCYRNLQFNDRKIFTVYSKSWVIVAQETVTKHDHNSLVTVEQHQNTAKDRDFVCFNRAPRELRCLFMLSQQQHLSNGHVTFLGEHPANVRLSSDELSGFFNAACWAFVKSSSHRDQYVSKMPAVLSQLPMEIAEDTANRENHTVSNPHTNHTRSRAWFEVVIETHDISEDDFDVAVLSEKVFWPILNQMPFILLGHRKNNRLLQDLGFKTYEEDFGVDLVSEGEIHQRLDAVDAALGWFATLSHDQKKSWYSNLTHKIRHNYQHLISTNWAELEKDQLRNIGPLC